MTGIVTIMHDAHMSMKNEDGSIIISIFGNPDVAEDALPVRLASRLRADFPAIVFLVKDPNELDLPLEGERLIVMDTVSGLKKVRWVGMEEISQAAKRVTAHDFDLATYLLFIAKIRKDVDIRILGIPMGMLPDEAMAGISPILSELEEGF